MKREKKITAVWLNRSEIRWHKYLIQEEKHSRSITQYRFLYPFGL